MFDHIDTDIIDTSFVQAGFEETLKLNDQKDEESLIVPVFSPIPENRNGRRAHTPIEKHLGDVLCISIIRCLYGLQALGLTAKKAEDIVEKHVSSISIQKAIRRGRKECPNILNVTNADHFEEMIRSQFQNNPLLKGKEVFKEESIKSQTFDLSLLDRAFARSKELISDLYNSQRAKSFVTEEKKRKEAIVYRNTKDTMPLPELFHISLATGTNASWLWQSYWYYRYVFEAATSLTPLINGFSSKVSAIQLYVLFRMCQEDGVAELTEHQGCKELIKHQVSVLLGLEKFMQEAEALLNELGLLHPKPKNTRELELRCHDVPGVVCVLNRT